MEQQIIDVTGLSPQQIAILQEIVAEFRAVHKPNVEQRVNLNHLIDETEQLKQLHQEFDWWVADIGVKSPLNRSSIYGIE